MNYFVKFFKHLSTITRHKKEVMKVCFSFGLYKQGIMHDLSKFLPCEFFSSVKYFQGDRSPIDAEKEDKGYSNAWMHHKSRNKHHAIYWIDYDSKDPNVLKSPRIPLKYVYEAVADSVGAGRIYSENARKEWSELTTFNYWKNVERNKLKNWLNERTLMVFDIIYIDIRRYGLEVVAGMIRNGIYEKFYDDEIPDANSWKTLIRNYIEIIK